MFEILFKSSKFFDQLKTIKTFACAGGHLNKRKKLRMLKVLNDKKIFIMYGANRGFIKNFLFRFIK